MAELFSWLRTIQRLLSRGAWATVIVGNWLLRGDLVTNNGVLFFFFFFLDYSQPRVFGGRTVSLSAVVFC